MQAFAVVNPAVAFDWLKSFYPLSDPYDHSSTTTDKAAITTTKEVQDVLHHSSVVALAATTVSSLAIEVLAAMPDIAAATVVAMVAVSAIEEPVAGTVLLDLVGAAAAATATVGITAAAGLEVGVGIVAAIWDLGVAFIVDQGAIVNTITKVIELPTIGQAGLLEARLNTEYHSSIDVELPTWHFAVLVSSQISDWPFLKLPDVQEDIDSHLVIPHSSVQVQMLALIQTSFPHYSSIIQLVFWRSLG